MKKAYAGLVLAVSVVALCSLRCRPEKPIPADNAIQVIRPYHYNGTWVFDDKRVNLRREPFVAGIPEMIDHITGNIPNAREGFRLLFSPAPFPGYQLKLVWRREENNGNWYYSEDLKKEGWLCPALFKYYTTAPNEIYAKAEALRP